MRTFETDSLADKEVANLLRGLDPRTIDLILFPELIDRVKWFNETARTATVEVETAEGLVSFDRTIFCALTDSDHLVSGRHSRGPLGGTRYAVGIADLKDATETINWRTAPHHALPSGEVELIVEGPAMTLVPSLVEMGESPYRRALIEARRQIEDEAYLRSTTRILMGTHALRLLRRGMVQETLTDTSELLDTVAVAQWRGWTRENAADNNEREPAMVIDILR